MKIAVKLFIATCLILCCVSCTKIVPYYKPDIQQGNEVTQEQVDQLHKNMTKKEVVDLFGAPVVQSTFDDNRLIYVDTHLPNRGKYTEKQLILYFKNDKLVSAKGDYALPRGF